MLLILSAIRSMFRSGSDNAFAGQARRIRWRELGKSCDDRFDPSAAVIPIAPTAIRRAFELAVNLAQVDIGEALFEALHFDAEARFKEAGLTKTERDIMLGSAMRILPGSQADLASIQDKLDWHLLDGQTYEEARKTSQ